MWIGRESIIMPGVKIGDGAIIAAYSVVVKDVPAYTVYGGNPARFIKERFDAELKDLLLRYQWWNLEPEKLVEILPVLCDPDLEKLRRFLREQLTDWQNGGRLTVLRQFFCAYRVQSIWISASFVSSSMPSDCTMNCSRR